MGYFWQIDLCVKQCSALHTRVEQKIFLFHFGNQFNKRWLYVSGLDVLGQSPRHNILWPQKVSGPSIFYYIYSKNSIKQRRTE